MMSAPSAVGSNGKGATGSTTGQDHPPVLLALPRVDPTSPSVYGCHGANSGLGIGAAKMGQSASLSTTESLGIVVGEAAWGDNVTVSTASYWSSHGGANGQSKSDRCNLHTSLLMTIEAMKLRNIYSKPQIN